MTNDNTPWDRGEDGPRPNGPRHEWSATPGPASGPAVADTASATGWVGDAGASLAVVEIVSTATEVDSFELPPLHNSVNTDALDALAVSASRDPSHDFQLTFRYAGTTVSVEGSGRISVFVD